MPFKITEACMQMPQQELADPSLACADEGDSWIMRVPKYAARTVLTTLKITSAGASKPLFLLHDVSCLVCCFICCDVSHSMPQMYMRASVAQYIW